METAGLLESFFEYFDVAFLAVLFVVGYICGSFNERRHSRDIAKREDELLSLPATTSKVDLEQKDIDRAWLVCGSVVVSIDYFKRIVAGLRNLVGGRVSSYESLVDRARREAVLRLKEQAIGADMIVNVRIETSSIGQSSNRKGSVGSVEALAYGTAVWLQAHPASNVRSEISYSHQKR